MVHFDIAFACALEPASVSVPEPHEIADDPLALVDPEFAGLGLLSEPHAESVAVASRPTPAASTYRWSFTAESFPGQTGTPEAGPVAGSDVWRVQTARKLGAAGEARG